MKILVWIAGIVLVLLLLIGITVFLLAPHQTQTTTQTGSTFPTSTSNVSSNTGSGDSIKLNSKGGGTITTNDFIKNGTTAADVEDPGHYYLAGSLGYCLANGTCPSGASTTDYHIIYDASNQYFNIVLLAEPLGQVRNEAEQYLMKTLGITQSQMCNLNYSVGTIDSVNTFYSGKELGFSFCPGAVQLP